ncbi:MAG: hypothetical protein NT094_01360, partial [Candidatus Staskawiczbacteria bacterium]|nr:hypothetical protein [Candidatus Staskawiczbacteria bacterium]
IWGKAKMALVSVGILAGLTTILGRKYGIEIMHSDALLTCIMVVSCWLATMSIVKYMEKYCDQ